MMTYYEIGEAIGNGGRWRRLFQIITMEIE
jgi:hypothetical protein